MGVGGVVLFVVACFQWDWQLGHDGGVGTG